MHPAPSLIIFTVFSGLGFGIIVWFCLGAAPMPSWITAVLALNFCITGLIASTFHLARPSRAWRALSQWRSSWLSREGVLALVTLFAFTLLNVMIYFDAATQTIRTIFSFLIALLALATVFATGMIYAQLRTVPRWHTMLTPCCFVAFSLTSGGLLVISLEAAGMGMAKPLLTFVSTLLLLSWALKLVWWYRADKTTLAAAGSTPASAIGLTSADPVRVLDTPHHTPNYLTTEMIFQIGRKYVTLLRCAALLIGALLPLLFLVGAATTPDPIRALILFVSAMGLHWLGLFFERWLFFAESEHVVGLYYKTDAKPT